MPINPYVIAEQLEAKKAIKVAESAEDLAYIRKLQRLRTWGFLLSALASVIAIAFLCSLFYCWVVATTAMNMMGQ